MKVCQTPRVVPVRGEVYNVPCGSRYCGACGLRWQGDQRVQAVCASEVLGGAVALITVTAPGRRFFRERAQGWAGGEGIEMDWWNDDARDWWRCLHLRASRPLREWASEHAPAWGLLYRSWEYQKRGALHLHLVLPYRTPEERRVTDLYVFNLWSCAREYQFGYVMGGETGARPTWDRPPTVKPADGPAAARYVCKYVASTGAGKEGMVDVAQRTAQRGSVLYISPRLTRETGVNMTKLRARRRIWARHEWARSSAEAWQAACVIDAIQRGRPPLTKASIERIRNALSLQCAGLWVDAVTGEHGPPTAAPPPPENGRTAPPKDLGTGRLVVSLAPVLLPDPDAPWLGEWRTDAQVWDR